MSSLKIRTCVTAITPEVMATVRSLGKGEDTIHVVQLCSSHGQECAFSNQKHPKPLHSGKVNGGPAYTTPFELVATLPPGATECQANLLLVNKAGGLSDDMARQYIRALDQGVHVPVISGANNPLHDLASAAITKLSDGSAQAQAILKEPAIKQLIGHLLPVNADQICAYDKVVIQNPAALALEVPTFSERVSAVGPRAIYRTMFDVKRV